jgi:hypothetical protein
MKWAYEYSDEENEYLANNLGEDIWRCVRCGVKKEAEISWHMKMRALFWSRHVPSELSGDFCLPCQDFLLDYALALRDIDELSLYTNKLLKVANEKDKNNGSVKGGSSKSNTRRNEWDDRDPNSGCDPQIIEERNRLAIFGNKNSHVSC